MRNKKYIISSVIILLTGVIYLTLEAQQKKVTYRTKFSGEWESKEPISIGGNILCSFAEGDRMNSKTMKIVEDPNFLIIENPNSNPETKYTTSREKLNIDGEESRINHGQGNEKVSTIDLSTDGQTMTIKSIVYFMEGTPYHVNVRRKAYTNLTEVWKLSSDGKRITVQSLANSNVWDGERSWKTIFYKTN